MALLPTTSSTLYYNNGTKLFPLESITTTYTTTYKEDWEELQDWAIEEFLLGNTYKAEKLLKVSKKIKNERLK